MRLNIKKKYKQTYKEKIVTVPILKDEYGEWEKQEDEELVDDDHLSFTKKFYKYIYTDEDVIQPLIEIKEVFFPYPGNRYMMNYLKLDPSTPFVIKYYGYSGQIILLMREIEFYPSGYVKRDRRRTKMDTDYLAFDSQSYKDGEKAL